MVRFILTACLVLSMLGGSGAIAQDAPRTMIVMDGSGSMWGRINGRTKLQIARRAVAQLVNRLPPEMEVGLMAYGHRTEGDCSDIQVLVRPGLDSAVKIRRAVNRMKFQGKTPLGAALSEAAESLGYEGGPVTVVMVTDGIDSCRIDPCKVAAQLERDGFDFTAHVIGFGLSAKEGSRVACIAKRTGGRYFPARNARALARALSAAMDVAPDDAMTDADPDVVVPESDMPDEPVVDAAPDSAPEVDTAAIDPATDKNASKQKTVDASPVGEPEAVAPPAQPAFFRGAPVMLNAAIRSVGNIGIIAQTPAPKAFAADGTIQDCQVLCEGDLLCAAWQYQPAGNGPAMCTVHDYSVALDYDETDPSAGFASGMKAGAVQLVRPYVPSAVAVVAEPEPVAEAIDVTVTPTGAPDDLSISWTATPLDDPEAEVVAADGALTGAWMVTLAPGEYAIEGAAEGYVFEDYLTVSSKASSFEIEGFATGGESEPADDAATADDMPMEEDMPMEDVVIEDEQIVEDMAEEPMDALPIDELDQVTVAPLEAATTLALPGAGTVTEAGYRCDAAEACGMQDAATGLVFALPPGWASDYPILVPSADGAAQTLVMTMFGPEAADGSIPTLLLNPAMWTETNGPCTGTAAGSLCVFGAGDGATQAAVDVIAPSLTTLASVMPEPEPGAIMEEPAPDVATDEPVGEPAAVGTGPVDGTWTGTVAAPVIAQCPAGFETALASASAALSGDRPIAWGGGFDPAKLGLDTALPGIVWSQTGDTTWRGEGPTMPIEGQPPFVMGFVAAEVSAATPDRVTGQLSLVPFAQGEGIVAMLNVGLMQCQLTADFELTAQGG